MALNPLLVLIRAMSALGQLADIGACQSDVRFTPNSGHSFVARRCPLSANSGHAEVSWIATIRQTKDQVLVKARPQALCIRPRVL
jgi:hypothetical protein